VTLKKDVADFLERAGRGVAQLDNLCALWMTVLSTCSILPLSNSCVADSIELLAFSSSMKLLWDDLDHRFESWLAFGVCVTFLPQCVYFFASLPA
jgi:hypothetical protein